MYEGRRIIIRDEGVSSVIYSNEEVKREMVGGRKGKM
jgi:hypothetical protein